MAMSECLADGSWSDVSLSCLLDMDREGQNIWSDPELTAGNIAAVVAVSTLLLVLLVIICIILARRRRGAAAQARKLARINNQNCDKDKVQQSSSTGWKHDGVYQA